MATTEPTTMVSAAMATRAGVSSHDTGPRATWTTRIRAANPATFVPAAMNPVTGVGAPWYTSGVHMWNGTAATLNENPTARRAADASGRARPSRLPDRASAIPPMLVVPVAP